MPVDPDDVTLASYESAAQLYLERSPWPAPGLTAFLDRFAALVPGGQVLELGSGSGRDADYLESRGIRVQRTDATRRFVELMRAAGSSARILDVRHDDLGGPYAGVLANAVLLHLSREQFTDALSGVRAAVRSGGVFGFTLKEGDGEGWSEAKLGLRRWFTYFREAEVRHALTGTGWTVVALDHVAGRSDDWLHVLARASEGISAS